MLMLPKYKCWTELFPESGCISIQGALFLVTFLGKQKSDNKAESCYFSFYCLMKNCSFLFLSFLFCLDTILRLRSGETKKIKDNTNGFARLSGQRHVTSTIFQNQFTTYTAFSYSLKIAISSIIIIAVAHVYLTSKSKNTMVAVISIKIRCGDLLN